MFSRQGIFAVVGAAATALLMTAATQASVSNATVNYSTNGTTFSSGSPAGFTTTGVSGLGIGYPSGGVLELNGTTISGSGTLYILVNATGFSGTPNDLNESLSATFSHGSGTLTLISTLEKSCCCAEMASGDRATDKRASDNLQFTRFLRGLRDSITSFVNDA